MPSFSSRASCKVVRVTFLSVLIATAAMPAQAVIVAATLPASRSVQVGSPATLFATIINAGAASASECGIGLASAIDAEIFFQTTDPATNALTGMRNQRVTIAPGEAQSFLVGITPNSILAPTDVALEISCSGESAASVTGLNTLLLSASSEPVPDIVAIALTPSGDGVAQLPKESGLGFLSLASVNVGSLGSLNVAARLPAGVEGNLLLCETNPATGACLVPAGASVDVDINPGGTPTFAVFASSRLALPLDPAGRRLFVEFKDDQGAIRGSTSVALAGGGPDIEPRLQPGSDGATPLPDGPASRQTQWILEQLSAADTPLSEISARFAFGVPADLQSFFDQLRLQDGFAGAKLLDVLAATPVTVTGIIGTGEPGAPLGFMIVDTQFSGEQRITQWRVSPYGGTVQFVRDQNLTLEQAAADFQATGTENSLVVAEIDGAGQCNVILGRDQDTARATASVYKIWILGAIAEAINEGVITRTDPVALDSNLFAQGGAINSEPVGTVFTVQEMATLMLGISDNSATDHLWALGGRERMNATVTDYGHATPDTMLPLLSISQHFSLYRSFSIDESLSYINGTEAQQERFQIDRMIPLGPVLSGPTFHSELLVDAFVKASPMDTCRTFSALRRLPRDSAGFQLVDEALSAGAAQPDLRGNWDRVWYKGGNLVGTSNDQRVLTNAWMLESAEHGQFVVVAFANRRVSGNIDTFEVQSLTSRIMQLLLEQVGS